MLCVCLFDLFSVLQEVNERKQSLIRQAKRITNTIFKLTFVYSWSSMRHFWISSCTGDVMDSSTRNPRDLIKGSNKFNLYMN